MRNFKAVFWVHYPLNGNIVTVSDGHTECGVVTNRTLAVENRCGDLGVGYVACGTKP